MNNVEKIKREAQTLRDQLNDRVDKDDFIAGEVFILNYFISYINSMQEEPVSEQNLSNVERTGKNWKEEPVSIDFEQELYKAFGQVKDFTLGMRIAKWFYDMGKNSHVDDNSKKEE